MNLSPIQRRAQVPSGSNAPTLFGHYSRVVPTPALDDRYGIESGMILLTGVQAVVRLRFDQLRRDRAAGVRTGVFVTGYPGSSLGGYDLALAQALRRRADPALVHRPALNEEMAATALKGTQLLERYPYAYDGVVGFWYGKGAGLDRAGDPTQRAELLVRELGAGTRTVSAAG